MDQWQTFVQMITDLGVLLWSLVRFAWQWALLIAWVAWWLGAVNWRKVWPVLGQGGWAPAVLLVVLGALGWSQIAPGSYSLLGGMVVSNFWWQLGAVSLLACLALFCGWLQGVFLWAPAEISVEPPAHVGHDRGQGHH